MDTATHPAPEHKIALPTLRKVFFVLCIVVFLFFILFLIYQNGKSIYDNGI